MNKCIFVAKLFLFLTVPRVKASNTHQKARVSPSTSVQHRVNYRMAEVMRRKCKSELGRVHGEQNMWHDMETMQATRFFSKYTSSEIFYCDVKIILKNLWTSSCARGKWGKYNGSSVSSLKWLEICEFERIAFRLCFKASPSAKPFIWKLVLFTCKWTKICTWIKLISIWNASHKDSLWNRGERQLRNHLLLPRVYEGLVFIWS